jgi:hypothetical protein
MTCKAIRQGDQWVCGRCGLCWDIDDDDRPRCLTDAQLKQDVGKEALKELHHIVEETKS